MSLFEGSTLGGLLDKVGESLGNLSNGLIDKINELTNFNELSAGWRLGVGLVASGLSAISIIGIPLLIATVPLTIQAAKDVFGAKEEGSTARSYGASTDNATSVLKQAMASTTAVDTALTRDLNTDTNSSTSFIATSLPQSFAFN